MVNKVWSTYITHRWRVRLSQMIDVDMADVDDNKWLVYDEVSDTYKFKDVLSADEITTWVAVASTHKIKVNIWWVDYYLLASNV